MTNKKVKAMLKVKLSPPILVNRKYIVFIDQETKRSFKNKRLAADYITKVEVEMNEALLFVNEFYSTIGAFYRTYFLADRDFHFKYDVENYFEHINDRLRYISIHTQSENFNTIILQALNICFESLMQICEMINKKSRSRYDMLTRRRIQLYRKLICLYKESFDSFKLQSIYEIKLKAKTA
jgi:hypothetical protein